MAKFEGTVATRLGLELIGLLGSSDIKLNFTRVAVGSGIWTAEQEAAPAEMSGLIREEMTLAISPESVKPLVIPEGDEPAGCYAVSVMLTNVGLAEGFPLREIGLFADHPTRGEILFAVDYAGEYFDFIPALPANAAPLEKKFNLKMLTGNAKEIFVNHAPVLLATVDDIGDHNTDPEAHAELLDRLATGVPEIICPIADAVDVGETPIYRFREFTPVLAETSEEAIQIQIDLDTGNFTAPVHDSGFLTTIANGYEQPAGMLQTAKRYKARCRRRLDTGQVSPWSEVVFFETCNVFNYPALPVNVSPPGGTTGVMECPKLISGPFAVVGDVADTHEATQYRMRMGDTVLHLSPELGAVTEYLFPAGLLQVSGEYLWEVRYKGALLGWAEWSTATSFYTASAFIIGDEAISFTGWDGHDNASSAGVALADGAALRSNGVDQGDGEGDWASFTARAKVRDNGLDVVPDGSTETTLKTAKKVIQGDKLIVDPGIVEAGEVTEEESANIVNHIPLMTAETTGGCTITASSFLAGYYPWKVSNGGWSSEGYCWLSAPGVPFPHTLFVSHSEKKSVTKYALTYGPGSSAAANGGQLTAWNLKAKNSGEEWQTIDSISGQSLWSLNERREFILAEGVRFDDYALELLSNTGATNYAVLGAFELIGPERVIYSTDISAGNFTSAPVRAHIMPKLTAATGPAGTAFVSGDFNEIPVETATLGTDTDTDRPDFILLESAKQTPAESFRRVAMGVSGLSNNSETRIAETQADTWKTGA